MNKQPIFPWRLKTIEAATQTRTKAFIKIVLKEFSVQLWRVNQGTTEAEEVTDS
jgi:hypothetical protein